jgi:hypothetical protein
MMKQQEKSGNPSNDRARAIFEKIMINSEEIGKMKLAPFEHKIIESVRAKYKENERLYIELEKEIGGAK